MDTLLVYQGDLHLVSENFVISSIKINNTQTSIKWSQSIMLSYGFDSVS